MIVFIEYTRTPRAVTTYSMSEGDMVCEDNLCIGREYEDLFQFLASMLQTLEIGTIRKKNRSCISPPCAQYVGT